MGLDSFWELPKGVKKAKFTPPLRLCGGMFSAHGEGSFRGGVYGSLVEAVTGESLYQEEIPPEVVRKMSNSLSGTDFENLPEQLRLTSLNPSSTIAVTREDYEDLCRMFSSYARLGATLRGWW